VFRKKSATEHLGAKRRSWAAEEATAILEKPTMPTDTLAATPPTADETTSVKAVEAAFRDGVEKLREQGKPIAENAGQQLDEAQRYVTERVKDRPVTAVLAGVGVGVVLGLLLSNRSQ
jgi:ElaB/YqjD/DUF883 family membrane-anchored ribosome-binding protein